MFVCRTRQLSRHRTLQVLADPSASRPQSSNASAGSRFRPSPLLDTSYRLRSLLQGLVQSQVAFPLHIFAFTATVRPVPQVIRHEVYDSKADVFSWGVMFAELLSARPPYGDQYLTPVQARNART